MACKKIGEYMLKMNRQPDISNKLIDWYNDHKRELPWRNTADPYLIWVSEIILQQTRVAQGLDYFLRFTKRFPDVQTLAEAPEDEVLKYWQGLGYYSRARNLHAAAKAVVEKHHGTFPGNYGDILALKGIGEYTAAAIASFSGNQPYPVVDGNVFRVLSRLFALDTPIDTGKGKKEFTQLAGLIMHDKYPGIHNQAIMEFGALHCTPQNPQCMFCPLQDKCLAFASGKVMRYPFKQNKTRSRNRYFNYFYITFEGDTWLNRREEKDIWQGLYEFPLIETEQSVSPEELQNTSEFKDLFGDQPVLSLSVDQVPVKHVLSHQVIYAIFYKVELSCKPAGLAGYLQIPGKEIDQYAVSRLIQNYLEKQAI